MAVIYSPLLLITAFMETRKAHTVKANRRRGDEDDEGDVEEWEQMAGHVDFESEGWAKKVESARPNVETDAAVLEIRECMERISELRKLVEGGKGEVNGM